MGSVLCRPAPPEPEPSLPAPGDEPVCPGFPYPALLRSHGWPPQPGPAAALQLRLLVELSKPPSQAPTAVCECPFPGSGPAQACPCMNESPEADLRRKDSSYEISMGHRYQRMPARCLRRCEHCCKLIVCFFHKWLVCIDCKFKIHDKCKGLVNRECAALMALQEPKFQLLICPERGLGAQRNRCAECRTRILPPQDRLARGRLYWEKDEEVRSFRRCDYSGRYYCVLCIRDHRCHIPARVIRNWDWTKRRVSMGIMRYLKYMHSQPVINLEKINSQIFIHVNELGQVREMRRDLSVMFSGFLKSCSDSSVAGLLSAFEGRPHLLDSPDLYSMSDLEQVRSKALLKLLVKTVGLCRAHIRARCLTCRSKGQQCPVCENSALLFPFDQFVVCCARCSRHLHAHCAPPRAEGAEILCRPECAGSEPTPSRCSPQRQLDTVPEAPGGGGATGGHPPSSARTVPPGARARRGPGSSTGSTTASATPRTLARTPMSEAWARALYKDRLLQEQEDRERRQRAKP
ncbi:differentially expressed in FDCP 8 homolog [Amphibalanus amphitrite]|uniref:differentially expressed in FDCP 8 homolog n=1 Tax=Amphibalanus amphitrite TaxID=1232801 RepID=UPI001C9247CE|nr:differentially expressed in FDCP 8 homolog [Amphibalanus amphitrite]